MRGVIKCKKLIEREMECEERREQISCKQTEALHRWRRLLPWRQRLHPFVKDVTQGESGLMRKDFAPACEGVRKSVSI